MNKRILSMTITGLILATAPAYAALDGSINAGGQINRLNDYIERERVAQQIEEDRAKKASKVEGTDTTKTEAPEATEVTLKLKDLVTDKSVVLTEAEIKAITKDYIGKKVSVKDLYKAVERINALYQEKGYVTCRAFLLQQTIENGVVKITLIEGKTGNVEIKNNKSTKENYIKRRIHLAQGEVLDVNKLNKELLKFNGTNDVQLRIVMQAGKKPGTTDYVIAAYEPKQFTWNVLMDNAGNENNGRFRQGVFFTVKSLSGSRDALTVGTIRSKGSKAVSSSYSHILGHSGTKLNIGYNTNSVKTIKGDWADLVKGHANSVSIGITQPWVVNEKTRSEAILELTHQKSSTDLRISDWSFRLVEDRLNDAFLGFAMTNYGKSHVFYQKHGFMLVKNKSEVRDEKSTHTLFKSNGFYQKAYKHGQNISARAELQWSNKDNVASARQFYIGGMNTVRGYEESFRGADKGINLSVEYAVPLNEKKNFSAFTFLDYGKLFGEDAASTNANNSLISTGLGVKGSIGKNIYANLTMGVPLKRHFEDGLKEPSKAKLNFYVSGQF